MQQSESLLNRVNINNRNREYYPGYVDLNEVIIKSKGNFKSDI